jgi:outer membrane protein OmpA-like peptidoglycan-associated protein
MSQGCSIKMNTITVNNDTQKPGPDNSASTPDLDFLTAWSLVACGNLDEAEHLLRKTGELPTSPSALDLLARIAVRKGQYEQAGQLWKAVLEKDPNHKAAKAAMERLDSPWIAVALIKRLAFLASIAIVLILSIVGLFALLNVNQQSQPRPVAPANSSTQIGATSSAFSVPGWSVHTKKRETIIVFDDDLFTLRCKLKNSARERLSTFAHLLQENAPNSRIIVEGHTDSYPMRKNSLYRDNYELGLQRALTVAEVLKSHHQIAGGRILVTSMGDANPPFPEADYESKLKNRTVVIRLF